MNCHKLERLTDGLEKYLYQEGYILDSVFLEITKRKTSERESIPLTTEQKLGMTLDDIIRHNEEFEDSYDEAEIKRYVEWFLLSNTEKQAYLDREMDEYWERIE